MFRKTPNRVGGPTIIKENMKTATHQGPGVPQGTCGYNLRKMLKCDLEIPCHLANLKSTVVGNVRNELQSITEVCDLLSLWQMFAPRYYRTSLLGALEWESEFLCF